MSRGQKPRTLAYFPRMRNRNPGRPRLWTFVAYDQHRQPIHRPRSARNRRRPRAVACWCGPSNDLPAEWLAWLREGRR